MAKGKSFTAKLAHEISTEGKVICPVCNTEIKRVKLIICKKSKADSWAPNYQFKKICKCNEQDIMSGKY
jgi:ribosomal protein S3AE